MLSNLITANKRELNPTSQANANIANDKRLFQPPGLNIDVRMSVFPPASAIFATIYHVLIDWPIKTSHRSGSWIASDFIIHSLLNHRAQQRLRCQCVNNRNNTLFIRDETKILTTQIDATFMTRDKILWKEVH